MTEPKFGRVNEMKKVTPRRSRRLRPSPSEADSMEFVVVPDAEFRESMDSVDDDEGGRLYNVMVNIDKAGWVF